MPARANLVADLVALDAALRVVTLRIAEEEARRRFLPAEEPDDADVEQKLVTQMDRIMTRIRAVEGKLAMFDQEGHVRFE